MEILFWCALCLWLFFIFAGFRPQRKEKCNFSEDKYVSQEED
jgi:hypothetical protein